MRNNPATTQRGLAFSVLYIFFFSSIYIPSSFADIDAGDLFRKNCTQCHTIGKGKLIGPDLKDAHKRVPSEEWMVPWIRNSQEVIKKGDAYALKIYEEYNKTVMTPNNLKDEEILAVINYIKEESSKAPAGATAAAEPGIPGMAKVEEKEDVTTIVVLLCLGVLFLLLSIVLAGVKKTLVNLAAEKKGLPPPPERTMWEGVWQWTLSHKRWVALGCILLSVWGAKAGWDSMLQIGVNQGYEPEQPIWFSHKIHAGENGIDCQYCHFGAAKSKTAGIPPAGVCMNCHKGIKEGKYTGTAELKKIYDAVGFDSEKGDFIAGYAHKPIEWVRVHNLPDFAWFSHAQHVTVGKIECQTCHGPVQDMHVLRQESPLTMGWCVDCHRRTEVKMEGNGYYTELHAKLIEKYPDQKITVDKIGGLDCARCHY